MPLLLVLWLQCPFPDSVAFLSLELPALSQPPALLALAEAANADRLANFDFTQSLLSCLLQAKQPAVNPEFSQYPEQISASSQPGAVTYEQRAGYYAIRFADPEANPEGAITVLRDETGAIALFQGSPPLEASRRNGASPLPVYGTSDIAVVPTGEIFIRFRKGINAGDRSAELETAGYSITKVLDFAPEGAWIHATSGSAADSLKRLAQLEGLVGIENIEPQLLMERSLR
jgi:hypothetical protein